MTHILQKDWSNSWLRSLYHTLSGHCLSAQSMMVRRVGLMGHEEMWLLVCVGCEGNQEFSSRVLHWLRRLLQLTIVKPLYIDALRVRFRGVFSSLNHVSAKRHGRATVEAHDFFSVWNPYRFRAKVLLDLVETALHTCHCCRRLLGWLHERSDKLQPVGYESIVCVQNTSFLTADFSVLQSGSKRAFTTCVKEF